MIQNYRGYTIRPAKATPNNLHIHPAGHGGKIPVVLSGLFTSEYEAKRSVDAYLLTKVKEPIDGKTTAKAGS